MSGGACCLAAAVRAVRGMCPGVGGRTAPRTNALLRRRRPRRLVRDWRTETVPAASGAGQVATGCAHGPVVVKLLETGGSGGDAVVTGPQAVLQREVHMALSLGALGLQHVVKMRPPLPGPPGAGIWWEGRSRVVG